jgi:PadR family transcriptional regulator PadR
VHPILARLEGCGWIESRWEDQDPHQVGRPRRRYYRPTPDGVVYIARALDRVRTPARLRLQVQPGPLREAGR